MRHAQIGFRRAVLLLAVGAAIAGCTTTTIPLTEIEVPVPKIPLPEIPLFKRGAGDFQQASWTEAFDKLHQQLAREYPFTEWKSIDWNVLYAEYAPQIAEAQEAEDAAAYYTALRGYLFSIPDGNIHIDMAPEYMRAAIGGTYGFSVLPLEDGRLVVYRVKDGGPAARIGMAWGAELLEWNGAPARAAVSQVPVLWAHSPPATDTQLFLDQCRYLTRAPVNEEVQVMFRNPDSDTPWVATLRAEADEYVAKRYAMRYERDFSEFEAPIETRTLDSGAGYMAVYFEAPTVRMPFPGRAFRKALARFLEDDAPGLILDLRGNAGGDHAIAAEFLGHFFTEALHYCDVHVYVQEAERFLVDPELTVTVTPREPHWDRPLVVLVHNSTIGAGEGMARLLARLPNARVLGLRPTGATFAVTGGEVTMPEDHVLYYPVGRMTGPDGKILLESNAAGQGGVAPDLRPPITLDTLEVHFRQDEDVLLRRAQELIAETEAAGPVETQAPE